MTKTLRLRVERALKAMESPGNYFIRDNHRQAVRDLIKALEKAERERD